MSLSALYCVVFDNAKGPIQRGSSVLDKDARCPTDPDLLGPEPSYFLSLQKTQYSFISAGKLCGQSLHIVDDFGEREWCGVPLYLESETYDRSCFRFCIVAQAKFEKEMYKQALVQTEHEKLELLDYFERRFALLAVNLARAFEKVEVDLNFVSLATETQMSEMLSEVANQLISGRDCFVPLWWPIYREWENGAYEAGGGGAFTANAFSLMSDRSITAQTEEKEHAGAAAVEGPGTTSGSAADVSSRTRSFSFAPPVRQEGSSSWTSMPVKSNKLEVVENGEDPEDTGSTSPGGVTIGPPTIAPASKIVKATTFHDVPEVVPIQPGDHISTTHTREVVNIQPGGVHVLQEQSAARQAQHHPGPTGLLAEKVYRRFLVHRAIALKKFVILQTWRSHYEAFGRFRFDRRWSDQCTSSSAPGGHQSSKSGAAAGGGENNSSPDLPLPALGAGQDVDINSSANISQHLERGSTPRLTVYQPKLEEARPSFGGAGGIGSINSASKRLSSLEKELTGAAAGVLPANVGLSSSSTPINNAPSPAGISISTSGAIMNPTPSTASTSATDTKISGSALPPLDSSRVPIFLVDLRNLLACTDFIEQNQLDLTLFEILPFIDGGLQAGCDLEYVDLIKTLDSQALRGQAQAGRWAWEEEIRQAGCDLEYVDLILRHLVKAKICILIDPIHDWSLYRLKPSFVDFFASLCSSGERGARRACYRLNATAEQANSKNPASRDQHPRSERDPGPLFSAKTGSFTSRKRAARLRVERILINSGVPPLAGCSSTSTPPDPSSFGVGKDHFTKLARSCADSVNSDIDFMLSDTSEFRTLRDGVADRQKMANNNALFGRSLIDVHREASESLATTVRKEPSRFSLRHFILFGLAHNFLTRILEYPLVRLRSNAEWEKLSRSTKNSRGDLPGSEFFVDLDSFVKLCDGTLHLERVALLISRDVLALRRLLTETLPKDPRVERVSFIRR
eukprot:g7205.t1